MADPDDDGWPTGWFDDEVDEVDEVDDDAPSTSAPRELEPPLWEQWAATSAELPQGERLQKVLSTRGFGSRRVCEDLISAESP